MKYPMVEKVLAGERDFQVEFDGVVHIPCIVVVRANSKKEARDKFNQMDLKKFADIVHIYFDEDDLEQIREEKPSRINILDTDKESVVEPESFPESMKHR